MYKIIFTLLVIFTSTNVNAASMILVFDGLVDTATRMYDRCLQPCDTPEPNDPTLPNYETKIRVATNAKFQAVFKVNWYGDPVYNSWNSEHVEGRLQVYGAESIDDTLTYRYETTNYNYSDHSKDVTVAANHGEGFSTMDLRTITAMGPTADWDQYTSSGSLDIYRDAYVGSWKYYMNDTSIVDPRIEVTNEAVTIRNYINRVSVNNAFSISEVSPFGFHYFLYQLEGMSEVTLTTYYGDTLPDLVPVPIPASILVFISGLVGLLQVASYNKKNKPTH